jgi:dipeptidase D
MTFVSELEPKGLWEHFDKILTIPRVSKNEEQIRQHVVDLAEKKGLEYEIDGAGNVVVRKPATQGHEGAATTILQSHLDMVTEKNSDVEHDFSRDPIVPLEEGGYLTADGTTLGSDNGIGVAAMFAVMESDDIVHGPLEFAFTIDEETGLTGAAQLNGDMLRGRRLLNLDSEEEGFVYVGCAGGGESLLKCTINQEKIGANSRALEIRVFGLKGGHSGGEIHLQRGNAIKVLARILVSAIEEDSYRLVALDGGNAHNAIPREASATVIVDASRADAVIDGFREEFDLARAEYGGVEPNMDIEIADVGSPEQCWDPAVSAAVTRLVNAVPHGVEKMSYDIADLVQTSTNLATAKETNGALVLGLSSRSSVATELEDLRRSIRSIGELAGAEVEEDEAYPGWKPNLDSHVLDVVKRQHKKVLGTDPDVTAIHAGLECGIIGEKIPGIDMVSFGPQIEFPHSPDERVEIKSVEKFYDLLIAVLAELA